MLPFEFLKSWLVDVEGGSSEISSCLVRRRVSLIVQLAAGRSRRRAAQARRAIEFVCLQRHAAVAQDAARTQYMLTVGVKDELELTADAHIDFWKAGKW